MDESSQKHYPRKSEPVFGIFFRRLIQKLIDSYFQLFSFASVKLLLGYCVILRYSRPSQNENPIQAVWGHSIFNSVIVWRLWAGVSWPWYFGTQSSSTQNEKHWCWQVKFSARVFFTYVFSQIDGQFRRLNTMEHYAKLFNPQIKKPTLIPDKKFPPPYVKLQQKTLGHGWVKCRGWLDVKLIVSSAIRVHCQEWINLEILVTKMQVYSVLPRLKWKESAT